MQSKSRQRHAEQFQSMAKQSNAKLRKGFKKCVAHERETSRARRSNANQGNALRNITGHVYDKTKQTKA